MNHKKVKLEEKVASPRQTESLAARLALQLQPGETVAFYGELGSGKTFFIKAICRTLGCRFPATSPTFTIMNEYPTAAGEFICHFDFYRLEGSGELLNLGLDEFFYGDYICLVEWADKIQQYLPESRWEVYLDFVQQEPEARKIMIQKIG